MKLNLLHFKTRKHSSRMRTDRTVTSDRIANKDEQAGNRVGMRLIWTE